MYSYNSRRFFLRLFSVFLLLSVFLGQADSSKPTALAQEPSDDNLIAYVGEDGNVWVVNADGNQPRQITFDAKPNAKGRDWIPPIVGYNCLRWSPDGHMLGFGRTENEESSVIVLQTSDFALKPMLPSSIYAGTCFDWAPTNRSLIFEDKSNDLSLFDIDTGKTTRFLSRSQAQGDNIAGLGNPDWAPVGNSVLFGVRHSAGGRVWFTLALAKFPDGTVVDVEQIGGLSFSCTWSPNGQRFGCNATEHQYTLFSSSGLEITEVPADNDPFWSRMAWSPNDKYIAYNGHSFPASGPLNVLRLVEIDGNKVISASTIIDLDRRKGQYIPLEWSPEGNRILARYDPFPLEGDEKIAIIDVANSEIREVATTDYWGEATWQPQVTGSNLNDLLARKETAISQLKQTTVDIIELPFPVNAFDETAAANLVQRLRSTVSSGLKKETNTTIGITMWSSVSKDSAEKNASFDFPSIPANDSGKRQTTNALLAQQPACNGCIAFVSDRDGDSEIYLLRTDVTSLINLTNNPARDTYPVWSPDGTRLAFVSTRGSKYGWPDIYVMNADGSDVTRVTDRKSPDSIKANLLWSPDGTHIVFTRINVNARSRVYEVNADGSGLRLLTDIPGDDERPAWSPDGKRIVFAAEPEYTLWGVFKHLFAMNTDGSGITDLTNYPTNLPNSLNYTGPTWSPDGSHIAFVANGSDGIGEIYVMKADGSNQTRLTNDLAHFNDNPTWQPNGTHIAFVSGRDGNSEIYIMAVNGSGQINLTNDPAYDRNPIWSSDGRHILFVSDRNGNDDIYIMNADGSGLTDLTNNSANDSYPAWAPVQGSDIGDLLTRKAEVIPHLKQASIDIVGLPFPVNAFDEAASTNLVQRLRSATEAKAITPEQVEAFARLTIQEEGLAKLLPLYSKTNADLVEASADFIGLVRGLGNKADNALKACNSSGNPFSRACLALRRMIDRQLLSLINNYAKVALSFIPDKQEQEDFLRLWDLLIKGVNLQLDAGETVRDILLTDIVKGPAVLLLVSKYVGQVQPSLDQGVRSADPAYKGSDPVWTTDGKQARAVVHMNGNADLAKIQADFAHNAHEELMQEANIAKLITDIADLGTLSPWAALAKIAAIGVRIDQAFFDVLAIKVNIDSMNCTSDLSMKAGSLAFNPGQPVLTCSNIAGSAPTSPQVASIQPIAWQFNEENAIDWKPIWSRTISNNAAYKDAVKNLLAAIDSGDAQSITTVLNALDKADQILASSTGQVTSIVLGSNASESQIAAMLTQTNKLTLDALNLYLLAASYATAPQNDRPTDQIKQAAGNVFLSLDKYSQTLQSVAPAGTDLKPLPIIQTVVIPDEVIVGEPFKVSVAIQNVGSNNASLVMIRVFAADQEIHAVKIENLGVNQSYTTTLQTQSALTGTITLHFEVATSNAVTDSRIDQVLVSEKTVPDTLPVGLLMGVSGLIVFGLILAVLLMRKRP